jgi:CelD/BcsL family acetyltransferase involved in cellulose biosynthesis
VVPLLDGDRRFVGPVGGAVKRGLLAGARCVLIPSRVDETSSLVAMEALASGTPVIAFRRGALPEIVEHGRTGFIVDPEEQMAEAIAAAGELRSADCRAAAEARFSAADMTRRYLGLYAQTAESRMSRRPSRPPAKIEVEEVRDDARLIELAADWGALCADSPAATPFQRPEWLLAARRHLAGGSALRSLAFHRGGRLVGLLPLESSGDRLRWIGTGVSDYLDMICAPSVQASIVEAALAHLEGTRSTWREIELDGLRPDALLAGCALPPGWRDARIERDPSPVLALPAAEAPTKIAYYRRRLSRAGAVEWRMATADTACDLLGALIALHTARWNARGQPGVLADPGVQRFHHDAALGLARAGLLRLYGLALDGRVIAALYGFAQHGRFHYYLSGFDPACAQLCAGVLVVDHAIQAAVAEGAREFDFLRGREAYKYGWGAADRPALLRRIGHE